MVSFKSFKQAFFVFSLASVMQSSFILCHEDLFPYEPPKNFNLNVQLPFVYHPVSTKNPLAQQYFDQGIIYLYAFNHDAAYWSFKRASEADPSLAMAYWGMALALGPNINMEIDSKRSKIAFQLVQQAKQLSNSSTENEKDYIEALSYRYTNSSEGKPSNDIAYKNAMEKVYQKYPDDLDAATLYAESVLDLNPWNQWDEKGNPKAGTLEVVQLLEDVLKKDPYHLGANHYYIHAIEASNYPERALMSAERLRLLANNFGHILHMPSHIYLLVGDYHLAALCNEQAAIADKEYIQKYGIDGIYPLHYLSHNLYFLSRAYSMEGRFEDALKAGTELSNFYAPYFFEMPELEYYIPNNIFVYLRFHKWNCILELPKPDPQQKLTTLVWHFARAIAFASAGKVQDAEKEQSFFQQKAAQIPSDLKYGYNYAKPIMEIADLTLKAKFSELNGNTFDAITYLQNAVAIQDNLHYNEPPDWYFPVRESLGGLFLRQKKYGDAEKIFRDDLAKHPRNGRSLFGLLESLKGQKKYTDAFWVNRAWKEAWQHSTTPLTINDL